jgi:curli production assembly/transport component CsgG
MKQTVLSLVIVAVLTGCATGSAIREKITGDQFDTPKVEESKFLKKDSNKLQPPEGGPLPVAVYGFRDLTGQRKSMANIASLSSAVTQGAENYLIKALQDVGDQRWFTVLERVGLENLIKERQLIRNQREVYEGKDAKPLKPLLVAGLMIEGGIIGYDTNITSGGRGARILGIGASTQYRVDEIVISMRVISVNTGEVLLNTAVSKTVFSTAHNQGVLKFVDLGTTSVELENGAAINEPTTYAVRIAIEQAVYEMIQEGAKRKLWSYKKGTTPRSADEDSNSPTKQK